RSRYNPHPMRARWNKETDSQQMWRPFRVLALIGALWISLSLGGGCASHGASKSPWESSKHVAAVNSEQLNNEVLNYADNFIAQLSEASDQVEWKYGVDSPKIRARLNSNKIGQTLAVMDIATGPNPEINLFDMTVMITLKKQAMEEFEIPKQLDGKGGE